MVGLGGIRDTPIRHMVLRILVTPIYGVTRRMGRLTGSSDSPHAVDCLLLACACALGLEGMSSRGESYDGH